MEEKKQDDKRHYVWFDWAVKHMLRNKANFGILEGFFKAMTGKDVKITELLESEGNQDTPESKYNRVDVKAKTSDGETVIIEVQAIREIDFMERVLFGAAKAITEQVQIGESYSKIHKVYSISIVYFDLGVGDDYVYHGQTILKGIHIDDELHISTNERKAIENKPARDIFPEYYIVRVRQFNPTSITPNNMEQWMDYLKTGNIHKEYDAPGLPEARERLIYDSMTQKQKKDYRDYVDFVRNQEYNLKTEREEGREEGRKEGRKEGREEGRKEERMAIIKKMQSEGIPQEMIEKIIGSSL